MTIGKRLKEERERLGFNQTDLAAIGGVGRKSQFNYEDDERRADAAYLAAVAAAGVDVRYVITGLREGPAPVALTAEEQVLVDGFRALDGPTRKRMMAFLYSGDAPRPAQSQSQTQHVTSHGGQVTQSGQIINHGVPPDSGSNQS